MHELGTKYPPFVPRKKCTYSGVSSLQACREITAAKRSLVLATNWNHSSRSNLEAAELRLKEAKNVVREAQNAVTLFKLQLSETKKMVNEEKLNLATLEEKHCVINLESDCDMNNCEYMPGSYLDSECPSPLRPLTWKKTRTISTKAKVTPANSDVAKLT